MADWHTLNSTEVLEELRTTENGISEAEARRRLQATGYNELKEKKKITPLTLFLNQFKSFLVLILVVAAVISYLIENIIDAILIVVIIIINALFGFIQEFKAEKTLESLKKLSTPRTKVIRDGEERLIDSRELVPGDILVINEGDKIPADARIIEVANLKVDESSLTGESIPVSKFDKVLKEIPLPERKNMLYLGTVATYGRAKAVVVDTGMSTEIGKIATLIQTSEQETPLQAKINSFGKWLGLIALIIAGVAGLIGLLKNYALTDMFLTSAALAVSAVPEGLPALLTITLAIGVQTMSRQRAIVRKLSAVEALGSTTVILADKTGTMTTNEMTVTKVFVNNQEIDVGGTGFEPKGEFTIKGRTFDPKTSKDLTTALTIFALCNDAVLTRNEKWNIIGDPTEGALLVVAKKAGLDVKELNQKYPRVNEIPFSSERKMMSTVHKVGK
ncbi:MAG: HAD-IC family P-type ATPase, partial [Candidatus Aenigmarchaeota archaeon]|nr:HAD-IC family P-type ATPase [Candidatus Aenigmarchaeota archaeon]